jgi:hypothetical protein
VWDEHPILLPGVFLAFAVEATAGQAFVTMASLLDRVWHRPAAPGARRDILIRLVLGSRGLVLLRKYAGKSSLFYAS